MRKSRALALVTVLIVSVLLLLPYFVQGLEWTTVESFAFFAVGMFALLVLLLTNPAQRSVAGKPATGETGELKTISVLACHGCELSDQREFERGDFVGKVLGKCPKCKNKQLYIRAIYAAEEKKEGKH